MEKHTQFLREQADLSETGLGFSLLGVSGISLKGTGSQILAVGVTDCIMDFNACHY